jgi:pyruvate/2-oxoglutarate/acetoin dehydrogenase E1 component
MKYIQGLNKALEDLLNRNENVVLFGEDIVDPYGGAFKVTKGLSTKFPNQVISTPISEAAIVGISGGMSIGGLKPIVEIMFGDFLLLALDQITNHLTKYEWMYNNQVKTPITIRATMGGRRGYGPTHSQSLEPILSAVPLLKIISPSHYHDIESLFKNVVEKEDGVKLFSEHKILYPKILLNESNCGPEFEVKYTNSNFPTAYISNCEFEQPELLIISHGGNSVIIEEVMSELLLEYELNVECVLPSMIKPFPMKDIDDKVKKTKSILFIEESPKNYGWSTEIIAQLSEEGKLKDKEIKRVGALELPIPSSTLLEDQVLPSKKIILDTIINWIA